MSADIQLDLSVLNDHHKDTFAHIKLWEARRDRTFYIIAVLLGFLFLAVNYPETVKAVVAKPAPLPSGELDLASLPVEILLSVGWAILFALVLRHCQASITAERQYKYLNLVEAKMATLCDDCDLFQREGRAYNDRYPAFSKWAYIFYAGLFPLGVVLVSGQLLLTEWCAEGNRFHRFFDGVLWLGVVVSFGLYRLWAPLRKRFGSKPVTPAP